MPNRRNPSDFYPSRDLASRLAATERSLETVIKEARTDRAEIHQMIRDLAAGFDRKFDTLNATLASDAKEKASVKWGPVTASAGLVLSASVVVGGLIAFSTRAQTALVAAEVKRVDERHEDDETRMKQRVDECDTRTHENEVSIATILADLKTADRIAALEKAMLRLEMKQP